MRPKLPLHHRRPISTLALASAMTLAFISATAIAQTEEKVLLQTGVAQITDSDSEEAVTLDLAQSKTIKQLIEKTTRVKPVVDADFPISLGVEVPSDVMLFPLPPEVVDVARGLGTHVYFVAADGRIVIVQPATNRIEYIIS